MDSLVTQADVVVIGAGYCGVTAAAGLARRGRSVVVVEAGDAAVGATARGPISGSLLGSVTYQVVHRSTRPVVVVPAPGD